jgi:N-acetylglutamate synthase
MYIREMLISDYHQVIELWKNAEGVTLTSNDSPANISRFLARNPGMSFVACDGMKVCGALLCGHDGLIGYIYHMAVSEDCRQLGLGTRLISATLEALSLEGIEKCQLVVNERNRVGQSFWQSLGWQERENRVLMNRELSVCERIRDAA